MAPKTSDYLTPKEVAKILRVAPETVMRKFAGRRGVIDLGSPERMHKRGYRILRIPRETLDEFIQQLGARK